MLEKTRCSFPCEVRIFLDQSKVRSHLDLPNLGELAGPLNLPGPQEDRRGQDLGLPGLHAQYGTLKPLVNLYLDRKVAIDKNNLRVLGCHTLSIA